MNRAIILGLNTLLGLTLIFFSSYKGIATVAIINVSGIRSERGNIIIQVYRDGVSYEKEQPYKQLSFEKKNLDGGSMLVKFVLEPGIYGFTLVDDENKNGKIDKSFIGIPKEGFGFSNFFMEKMKKPKFEEFQVNLSTPQKVSLKVKYL